MEKITNREAITATATAGDRIDDMRLPTARAAGVGPAHDQIFDIIYPKKYVITGKEGKQRVFIPPNSASPGIDKSSMDGDAADFPMGKPVYSA